jgi:transcriptional regulator with XRE-family HTH domain
MHFIPLIIKQNRNRRSWTLEQLAKEAGISRDVLIKIENHQASPRWGTVEKIFEALKIPLWKAMVIEEMDDAIPSITAAVVGRLQSGLWRRERGQPEPKGHVEEKLADEILRAIDKGLHGRLMDQVQLVETAPDERWSGAQLARVADTVARRFAPEEADDVIRILQAVSALRHPAEPDETH